MFSDDDGCGATWSWSGPPCGGCIDCAHAMVEHSYWKEVEEAHRYHGAGLEWAPGVIDTNAIWIAGGMSFGEWHDWSGCDRAKEEERWPRKM